MPVYETKDKVTAGMPFGGIGAGKFEITPQGLFNAFTFQNNWSKPLMGGEDYPGVLGYHLGFFAEEKTRGGRSAKKAFLLQTIPVRNIPTVSNIRYDGSFPRAILSYEEPGLGIEILLEIFSPWLPGDVRNSSLPVVFFNLKVKNNRKVPVTAGFLFIGRNTSGEWCVGRQNRIYEDKKTLTIEFSNQDPTPRDTLQGAFRFTFLKNGWQSSFMKSWNAVTRNFSFNPENISLEAWDLFKDKGVLPNTKRVFTAQGENQELCGAVMARRMLKPKAESVLSFNAVWYFPTHPAGHRYAHFFKDAAAVARYVTPKQRLFRNKIKKIQRLVFSLKFPDWFKDALMTSLTPFFASSWYTQDERFAFYEAPVDCPLMGTVDVGFYGSIPLSYFFPKLEQSLITQFAKAQRADGYIPHDLGRNRLDLPSNGTTFFYWKDLNPKFILMVYRDTLWSGDRRFLKVMYPHVKKALAWSKRMDFDRNGLPDHEGVDHTFDLWEFRGTNAYTSGIFLAALLACERMGGLMKDASFSRTCRASFEKGKDSFNRELWNGKFFGQTCSLSQLDGQWMADLLGLGLISEREKIQKAIRHILRHHTRHSDFGMVNSTLADGRLDESNDHSKNVWLGTTYAFVGLGVSQGFALSNLLKQACKVWDNIANIRKSPWNQPDMMDAKTGQFLFGDFYYRNMAIWAIPIAYAARDKKTAAVLRSLKQLSR